MNTLGDSLRPKHYRPNIALVNTWKQGNFAQLLPKLEGYFPESAPIRAFGYQASEGQYKETYLSKKVDLLPFLEALVKKDV